MQSNDHRRSHPQPVYTWNPFGGGRRATATSLSLIYTHVVLNWMCIGASVGRDQDSRSSERVVIVNSMC